MLARASVRLCTALDYSLANALPVHHWIRVCGKLVKRCRAHHCGVGIGSFGVLVEDFSGCSGVFPRSFYSERHLATGPVEERSTVFSASPAVCHAGGAACSVHPLEELLYDGESSRAWLQLLCGTCANSPLPRQRIWGGSYREVVPTALPPPLRLSISVATDANDDSACCGEEGGLPAVSCFPDATEGAIGMERAVFLREKAVSEHRSSSVPRELILGLLRAVGVTHLLPLQQFALPLLVQEQTDVLLAAPAGTGKTLAVALAVLSNLAAEWDAHQGACGGARVDSSVLGCVRALIVTPTRDMATQTRNLLQSLGRYTPLRVGFLSGRGPGEEGGGGAPWGRFSALQHLRPHVVVCTPGKAEELAQFLLAAEETGAEKTGQVPKGMTNFLSGCRLLVVEDANLQLQEPLMLRTVARLKELLPADHKCIMLASSLSWNVQSCAARLMRVNSVCLNCIEDLTPITSAFQLNQINWRQVAPSALTVHTVTAGYRHPVINGGITDEVTARIPTARLSDTAAVETEGAWEAVLAGKDETLSPTDDHEVGDALQCGITAETWTSPCTLHLEQPQVLWGPKRSGEFLAKKRCELNQRSQNSSEICKLAVRGVEADTWISSRHPDEFLLYPPELHGHFLFNVLAEEALLATKEADAPTNLLDKGPFRRVLVFFNSTKSLQFHYALFKHFLFPNIRRILKESSVHMTSNVSMEASRSSDGGSRENKCSTAECLDDSSGASGWPGKAPLPTLWALHSRLSSERRRVVVEAFSSDSPDVTADGSSKLRGLKVLFCTDVAAVGVQLGPIALVLQVGAPKSVELYVQRAARASRLARKLVALSDLDGHFLYECYKECIPLQEAPAVYSLRLLRPNRLFSKALGGSAEAISYRSALERLRSQKNRPQECMSPDVAANASFDESVPTKTVNTASTEQQTSHEAGSSFHDVDGKGGLSRGELAKVKPIALVTGSPVGGNCSLSTPFAWAESPALRASCELMYRSLLGMYSMQSTRLKFERWQVPSFVNAMLLSIGVDEPPAVTKQMAARLQLIQAPGGHISREHKQVALLQQLRVYPHIVAQPFRTKDASCVLVTRRNILLLKRRPVRAAQELRFLLGCVMYEGLKVDYHATSKTDLLACLPSCPGFLSRWRQLHAEGPPTPEVSAAFLWNTGKGDRAVPVTKRDGFHRNVDDSRSVRPSETPSVCPNKIEQEFDSFAPLTLYPPRLPWAVD